MGKGVNVSKYLLGGGTKRVEGIEEIQAHAEGERSSMFPLIGIDDFYIYSSLLYNIFV